MDAVTEQYYREHDPMKRKALLEQAIQSGEDAEANAIRKELWEIRYQGPSELGSDTRADGYLAMWMTMEFNRDAANKFFGEKNARKDLKKHLDKMKFMEFPTRSELHREIQQMECIQMIRMYIQLCQTDKSYNTFLCGLMSIGSDNAKKKIRRDIYETAVRLPQGIKMEEEFGMITKAAREVYEEFFPGEGGLPQ